MTRPKASARLNLLTVKEVQNAPEGDLADGGGLLLRVRGTSSSWVFRYTAPSGRRREMGLGIAHRHNATVAGQSARDARDNADAARKLLRQGRDPLEARTEARRAAHSGRRGIEKGREGARALDARAVRPRLPRARHRALSDDQAQRAVDREP